jgi:hypothetical protein
MTSDPKMPYIPPPPVVGNANAPGSFIDMDQGGYQWDPSTGSYYGVNPWDANSYGDMMSDYRQRAIQSALWGGGSDVMGDYDWETKRLQDKIAQLKEQKYTSKSGDLAKKYGLEKYVDSTTGEMSDMNDILSGKDKRLRDLFWGEFQGQGGHYGGTGEEGFRKWLTDVWGKNSNLGNKRQQYINDLTADKTAATAFDERQKKTLDYYNNLLNTRLGSREQIAKLGAEGPGGIMGDVFKQMSGGGAGGANKWADPYRESWDKAAAMWGGKVPDYLKRAESSLTDKLPFETDSNSSVFDDFGGIGGGGMGRLQAQWDAARGGGAEMQRTELPDAPNFDPSLGGQMRIGWDQNVLRAAQAARQKGADSLARRGLGGSSFGELNAASIGLDTSGRLNDNLVRAAQFTEDQRNRNFDQKMQRAGLGVNQESAIADAANRAAQGKFSMMGDFNRMAFDANRERYGRQTGEFNLKQRLFDDWFKRGIQAQGMSNDMNSETWNRNMEGLQGAHGQQMDMLGYLRSMVNDQHTQDMQKRGVYLQGLGTAGNLTGQYNADQANRDAANAGLGSQYQFGNLAAQSALNQSIAAGNQATMGALGTLGSNLGASAQNWWDKRTPKTKSPNTWNAISTPKSSGAGITYDPKSPWGQPE